MTLISDSVNLKRKPKKVKGTGSSLLEVLNRLAAEVPDKAWDSVPREGSVLVNKQGIGEL